VSDIRVDAMQGGPDLDVVFSALSDRTRRAILAQLVKGNCSVSELAEPHEMSLTAVSKHLTVLESAGLIRRERRGRTRYCRLRAEPLRYATDWTLSFREFWTTRLDALEDFFAAEGEP
jgi:DNA-binding transcriptional ArsR family regulator